MTIGRLLLIAVLIVSACKQKEEAKPAPGREAKPAEPVPVAPVQPTAAAGTKPAGGLKTQADYEATSEQLLGTLIDTFANAGTDCKKLATAINKFADDNKAAIDATTEFEAANPDAKRQLKQKMQPKQQELAIKLGPMKACSSDQSVAKALARIGD